jgi:putative heme degradation protein
MKTLPYYAFAIGARVVHEAEIWAPQVIARIIRMTGSNFRFMKKQLAQIERVLAVTRPTRC